MGLLDTILSEISGANQQAGQAPVQSHSMLESALGMIQHQNVGGIGGLVQKFEAAGLGHLMSGWVGTGANPPATPSQLSSALGAQTIERFSQQNGLTSSEGASALAKLLPHLVDQMTPNGQVPQQGLDMGTMLAMLKSKLA